MPPVTRFQNLTRFAAGALLINVVPHTVHALRGKSFPTPFANPPGVGLSSPRENFLWGAINLVAGGALLRGVARERSQWRAVLAGGASMAVVVTYYFGRLDLESARRASDSSSTA